MSTSTGPSGSGPGAAGRDPASERRELEERLARAEEELARLGQAVAEADRLAAVGRLAAGVTHELKNPLAGIIGFAQLCAKLAPEGSPLAPHLAAIEREGIRAKEILEGLLRFARGERAPPAQLDLSDTVGAALALCEHRLQLAKVVLERSLAARLPRVLGSPQRLVQVFVNLLLNAGEALQPGGGRLEVSTRLADDGAVCASFRDHGRGISPEDRARLFTPFFSTAAPGRGTGLGLWVSLGIVREHGGDIVVESESGRGSCFEVRLPAAGSRAP